MTERTQKKRVSAAQKTPAGKERERIRELLEKCPSPEVLSIRPNSRGCVAVYIEGWVAIDLANKIFGYDGWSSRFRSFTKEYASEAPQGDNGSRSSPKFSVAYSCVCRVELKCGTCREDIGFGKSENMPSLAQAIEKAKKAAATDALKRALRQFGNAVGNCCYNKKFGDLVSRYKRRQAKLEDFSALSNIELLKATDFESKILQQTEGSEQQTYGGSGIQSNAISGRSTGDKKLELEQDKSGKRTGCRATIDVSEQQQVCVESSLPDDFEENYNVVSGEFADDFSD